MSPRYTNYKPYIINASVVFGLSQLIPFIAYFYIANYTTNPQEYIDNLKLNCPPHVTQTKVFHERAFPYIGKTALSYFAYLGILVHHKVLLSNTSNYNSPLWKSLMRLAIAYMICWVFIW